VRLNFFRVLRWKNIPDPREDQAIAWQRLDAPMAQPMLPANAPVLASLALPSEYAITDAGVRGAREMLSLLEKRLEQGLKLVQVREPQLPESDRALFTKEAIGLAHRYGCKVMVKAPFPGADGIHFTASDLKALKEKPGNLLVAASCHTREEVDRAMQLNLDFVVIGPVKRTASHEAVAVLGWKQFAVLARGTSMPVYAIGGLRREDLEDAWRAGAHGLAMISGAWR